MADGQNLPQLRNDVLLFQDTSGAPLPGKIVPCLLCTKPFLMRKFIGTPDQICPECWEVYKDAAVIVCFKCNVAICRIVPKVLENGFYVRPSMVLHSDSCNICKPGLKQSVIVEIDEWQRHLRPKKIIVPMRSKSSGTQRTSRRK